MAVILAGRRELPDSLLEPLSVAGRWAAHAHVLDFDDLHLESTTHISAVCLPAALATGGGALAYLAGAGVMARLGTALGWKHYTSGWHATCTAGAPAAAVVAAVARGLDAERISTAMALAVPAAGGVQRAFGTSGKSLQVAFAAEAGIRAADLAAAGADAEPSALEDWFELVGGQRAELPSEAEAVPGGLAVKLYPCCYALQRPIAAAQALGPVDLGRIRRVQVLTPAAALTPLIHHRPITGLEGKFSLEYGMASGLLDHPVGLDSFSDQAVGRGEAGRLMELVEVLERGEGDGLLVGDAVVVLGLDGGGQLDCRLELPPGSPQRPLSDEELSQKLEVCAQDRAAALAELSWDTAAAFLEA